MRKKLIIGNWKLNGRLADNQVRLQATVDALVGIDQVDIGLCLPYVYLFQAQQLLANTRVMWGAQNVSQFEQGAYTSCVSAEMVAEFGCQLVILGHSERRLYSGEDSAKAAMRIKRAVDAGITPVYCIGETLAEHTANQAKQVIASQVLALFDLDAASLEKIKTFGLVIAYEPVWAIGAQQAATPALVQEVHVFIRELLAKHDVAFAANTRIIYGGSLTPDNARAIFNMPDIDGGLVGRCALNVHAFSQICAAAMP